MTVLRHKIAGYGLAFGCFAISIVPGCCSGLFYPDQSPGLTLAKKLGGPAEAVEWTLRQSSAIDVKHGVDAICSFAEPEQEPAPDVPTRLIVIDGLGRIAERLATTDWPEGREQWRQLTPRLMFWHAARFASTLDDPASAFGRIRPAANEPALYSTWLEVGTEVGVFERSGQLPSFADDGD